MRGTWSIQDNHIVLSVENEMFHPSADELYGVIEKAKGNFVEEIECEDIEESFPKIRFSKVGTDIKCRLSNDGSDIRVELFCDRKGQEVPVDVIQGQIIDQCVTESEWFYVTGSIEEIEKILSIAKIGNCGKITVSQYIEILRNAESLLQGSLINIVETSILDKPIDGSVDVPRGIQAMLYKYQKTGFLWMKYMLEENGGCILGDEMGLGKTLQVITLMQEYKNCNKAPMLVVTPVSLLQNWKNECKKFAPDLNVFVHHGSKRTGRFKELEKYDVIVISYNTAVSDTSLLSMLSWNLVVLDEAQNIKNPDSERTRYVKKIPRKKSIAVSGTPFENHVMDIWSLVDFVLPGLLGNRKEYSEFVSDDLYGADKIEPILSPIMIRRMVVDVASDLPEKMVVSQPIEMSDEESLRYEGYRKEVTGQSESLGLGVLQKLRMYCTHPQVCGEDLDRDPYVVSVKYQRMCELLGEIIERNEKVILFTSYQKMFDILEKDIPLRFDIPVMTINGSTPVENRQEIVDIFNQHDGCMLLALNPRAAGTGLNIAMANHVIHYNLEWNPALEAQASARAYRRGQEKQYLFTDCFIRIRLNKLLMKELTEKKKSQRQLLLEPMGNMKTVKILFLR